MKPGATCGFAEQCGEGNNFDKHHNSDNNGIFLLLLQKNLYNGVLLEVLEPVIQN